ncbi:aspartyl protease family protein [Asticcacaulis biprosthecium]|nr:aspartyl protease family protein [Asticcacaulis biprosthecium]
MLTLIWLGYTSAAQAQIDAAKSQQAIEVPFHLQSGHVYIDVSINGQGPFHFIFDTGSVNVMTPATAAKLGLKLKDKFEAQGTGGAQTGWKTKVDTFALASLTRTDQAFYVLDLPATVSDGVQVDGLIGFEWLKQFPVKFDYDTNVLTFYTAADAEFSNAGQAISMTLKGKTPQITGNVDGFSGRFTIDTGSNGSLTLSRPFVEKNDLVTFYHAKTKVMSAIGLGGPVYSLMARARTLDLGGVSVDGPVTFLSQQTQGTSVDSSLAGNIGYGVLHRFNIVFDYPNSKIYLKPNTHWAEVDLADRSGLRLDAADGVFLVVYVAGNSPGSIAGLKIGDRIVSVNGTPPGSMTLPELRQLLKGNVGTKVNFTVDGGEKVLVLELQDL